MLFAQELTKSFATRVLFDRANATVSAGEKVGLVGPNGAGKSTLLRMFAGIEEPTSGHAGARGGDIGYLKQESDFDPENSLKDEMWTAFPELLDVKRQLEAAEAKMAEGPEMDEIDAISAEIDTHYERFRLLGGDGFEGQADRILMGLGFKRTDLDKKCSDFSGGWRMRIALAKMLLRKPEHALLDEPTNHLDKAATEWLAEELADYPGIVLIVSHQQKFLDKIVKRILEVRDGKIISYTGNYSDFLKSREEKKRQIEQAAERQQREIAKQQQFIERFRSKATKAKQVQSRIKALEKVEKIEAPKEARGVHFVIRSSGRLEQHVLKLSDISHDWDGNPALLDVSLNVERGHKIALTGPNGGGKSTLLRIIAGEVKPDEGTIEWSERAMPGYYAQHQDEALDKDSNVLEEVRKAAGEQSDEFVRGVLGRFLFTGDDVFKPVSALSGGERSRLALAKFLIGRTNVLLLDEPTNHLDAASREELLKALAEYDGTIICASHDPAIVDQIATHVYHMDGGELTQVKVRDDRLTAAGRK